MAEKHPLHPPPPGPRFERRVPEGDTMERYVCGDCGHIYYTNPKIVVGSVAVHEGRVLLCRRGAVSGHCLPVISRNTKRRKTARGARRRKRPSATSCSTRCSRSIPSRG